jgi:predicted nucleic-acid-binding Zn-ribbon protein
VPDPALSLKNYTCPKCGHAACEVGEAHVAGGVWSKVFDVEGVKFSSVTCEKCSYTEFYKTEATMLSNVFDLFTN